MKHKNTQKLTLAAMTAAAYAALSLLGAVFGLTFGPIQVRFSEALCLLPFLFPETAWGLGVGVPDRQPVQPLWGPGHRGGITVHPDRRPADRPVPQSLDRGPAAGGVQHGAGGGRAGL